VEQDARLRLNVIHNKKLTKELVEEYSKIIALNIDLTGKLSKIELQIDDAEDALLSQDEN